MPAEVTAPLAQAAPNVADNQAELEPQVLAFTARQVGVAQVAGDLGLVRALIWSDRDPEGAFADGMARSIIARYAFYHAVAERALELGPGVSKLDEEFGIEAIDALAMMMAQWEVEGDRAIPNFPGGGAEKLPNMRRVRGIWKLDMTPHEGVKDLRAAGAELAQQAKALDRVTAQIVEGKLKKAPDISTALKAAGFVPDAGR